MGTERLIPAGAVLPEGPSDASDLLRWSRLLARAVTELHRQLVDRIEGVVLEGTAAQRPAAAGTRRLYFATDTDTLYYDDGAWNWVSTANFTAGSIPYSDGSKLVQDNTKLYWDATNKRLGLNINSTLLAQLHQVMPSASELGRIVKAAASQTASLDEWRSSANAVMSKIDAKGSLATDESERVAPWIEPEVRCSTLTSITSTTATDITGATITFTPKSDCRIQVTAFFDVSESVAGTDVFIGELVVGGSAQAAQVVFDPAASGVRATVGNVWNLTLTGGTSYTIKLTGRVAVGSLGSTFQVINQHTGFSIIAVGRF